MSKFNYTFRYTQPDKKLGTYQITLDTYDEGLAIAHFEKVHPGVEWISYVVEEFKAIGE